MHHPDHVADALSGPGPLTVFAPNDYAFMRTAADLGIRGSEEQILAGLAAALGDNLDDVLLYHVASGRQRALSVLRAGDIQTLNGQSFGVRGLRLIDNSELSDPWLNVFALNVPASNGIIHGITRVLLPDALSDKRGTGRAPWLHTHQVKESTRLWAEPPDARHCGGGPTSPTATRRCAGAPPTCPRASAVHAHRPRTVSVCAAP
ncbi:MAG: fasciclin domain-containing protein [Acidimicrobiales bacterium]